MPSPYARTSEPRGRFGEVRPVRASPAPSRVREHSGSGSRNRARHPLGGEEDAAHARSHGAHVREPRLASLLHPARAWPWPRTLVRRRQRCPCGSTRGSGAPGGHRVGVDDAAHPVAVVERRHLGASAACPKTVPRHSSGTRSAPPSVSRRSRCRRGAPATSMQQLLGDGLLQEGEVTLLAVS